jgi:hypothetical protein
MTAVAVPYPALTSADPRVAWLIPTLSDLLASPERLAALAGADEDEPAGIADDPAARERLAVVQRDLAQWQADLDAEQANEEAMLLSRTISNKWTLSEFKTAYLALVATYSARFAALDVRARAAREELRAAGLAARPPAR